MTTVAIYARYSDEIQNPSWIDDQIALCRKFAEAQGWMVTHTYADAAKTGRTAHRPQSSLRQRGRAELSQRLAECARRADVLEKIGDHTRRGLVGALEREGRMHSLAYGYRKVEGRTGLREIDPDTAPIVMRIFLEAAEGRSGDDIARELNRDGIPGPKGGIWYASTICGGGKFGAGLRKTIYGGVVTYGRTQNRLHPETGARRIAATPDKRTTKEIPELSIVPRELLDQVQARLAESAQKVAGSAKQNARAAHRNKKLYYPAS